MTPTTQKITAPKQLDNDPLPDTQTPEVCPHCGSDSTRESSTRRGMDLFPRNIGKIPYRCRSCRGRFYIKAEAECQVPGSPQSSRRKGPSRKWKALWRHPSVRRHMNEITIACASVVAFAIFLYILARSGIAFY